jgi:hypothetical protein
VVARETASDGIVGMIAVHRVPMRVDGRLVIAGIQGDFAVDEEHRGGFGPAVPLVRTMNAAVDASELAFTFGAPNANSRPVVLALSCEPVGSIDLWAKPLRVDLALAQVLSLPRPLRTLARPLGPLTRALFRDDRYRLRRSAFRIEPLDRFDDRFRAVATEAATTYRISLDRSPAFLNWKFGFDRGEVGAPYTLLALIGSGDAVRGYAVVKDAPRGVAIVDIVCSPHRREGEQLIGRLAQWARGRGAASIGLHYCGPSQPLPSVLRSFGFLRFQRDEVVLAARSADESLLSGLLERTNWYYVGGDADI